MKNDLRQCDKCRRQKECEQGTLKVQIDAYGRCLDFEAKTKKVRYVDQRQPCVKSEPNQIATIFLYGPETQRAEQKR